MTHNRDSEVCIDQAIAGIVALGHDIVTCGESFVESSVTAMDISSALANATWKMTHSASFSEHHVFPNSVKAVPLQVFGQPELSH